MGTQVGPRCVYEMWIKRVRVLTGAATYNLRYTPRIEKICVEVARNVSNFQLDLRHFVDAQIQHVIKGRRSGSLWPNIMQGQAAISRCQLFPTDDKEEEYLREMYDAQYDTFMAVCENISEEAAFNTGVLQQTPVFVLYMHFERGRTPCKGLVEDAMLELEASPVLTRILPEPFMKYLEAHRAQCRVE